MTADFVNIKFDFNRCNHQESLLRRLFKIIMLGDRNKNIHILMSHCVSGLVGVW